MEFRILGPLEVSQKGNGIPLGGPKQRAVLAVLLLHRGEVVSASRLVDDLWGERPPPTAAKSLQVYVSQLRKALGNGMLETRGRGYLLHVEPGQIDVEQFVDLLERGREQLAAGDAREAAGTLREALSLWRGPPLADFDYEAFARSEIARLEELRFAALEERIEADLRLGRQAELVPELESLVREHPLRERLRGQLMLALYRTGDRRKPSTPIIRLEPPWSRSWGWSPAQDCRSSSGPSSTTIRSSTPSRPHRPAPSFGPVEAGFSWPSPERWWSEPRSPYRSGSVAVATATLSRLPRTPSPSLTRQRTGSWPMCG